MCKFFSFDSDGKGNFYYFDWKLRKQILSGKLQDYEPDSHTSIADYFGFKAEKEDELNKYEYNPLTKDFVIDQINTTNDSKQAEKWANRLDFSKVVKPLILKPIIYPFKIKAKKVTKVEIKLLQKWNSVGDSVGDSVRDSVWNSVRDSVGNSVWNSVGDSVWNSVWNSVGDSVWNSVWDSVRDSVRDSVGNSVWNSVGDSVWNSVWNSVGDSVGDSVGNSVWNSVGDSVWNSVGNSVGDSVRAYVSGFFKIKYKYSYKSCIKLWEKGFVPSFDGKIWRLHAGEKAEIVFEISQKELKNYNKETK